MAACVVAGALGLVAGIVVERPVHHASLQPATPQRMIEGFPEYANGGHVQVAGSARLPQHSIELTATPQGRGLVFYTRCEGTIRLLFSVAAKGHVFARGGCGLVAAVNQLGTLGLSAGEPATFVLQVTGAQPADGQGTGPTSEPTVEPTIGPTAEPTVAPPASGGYGFAVGVRVPFDEYRLPPRPTGPLPAVTAHGECGDGAGCPGAITIRSDPADPAQTIRRTVAWTPMDSIDMVSQTPGYLHIRVNGVEVATGEWWDYESGDYLASGDKSSDWHRQFGLNLRAGEAVSIEVVPEHTTGAWEVVFAP
jgi:hypothetical protein